MVEEVKLPPGKTVSRLVGTVRLVSVARRRGPARLAVEPGATTMTESNVADPPLNCTSGSVLVLTSFFPPWSRKSGGSSTTETSSMRRPEAKFGSPTSPTSKASDASPELGASQLNDTTLNPV